MDISLNDAKLEDLVEQMMTRQRSREQATHDEERWKESEEKYRARQREEHRKAWAAFHLSQAENLERTAVELATSHRARAQKLLGEEC